MNINKNDTAVVFIDPQNDVLSEKGVAWRDVGESVRENNTIENMERISLAAKANVGTAPISPHYFFPTDGGWLFNGPVETSEHETKMFARRGVLNLRGSRLRGRRRTGRNRRSPPPGMGLADMSRRSSTFRFSRTPCCPPTRS